MLFVKALKTFMKSQAALKETALRMMRFSAKVLGAVFESHAKYIEQREGKEGVRRVEETITRLGYPMKFKDIKTFKHYSVGLADLPIIVSKEIFGWQEKDVFDMGNTAPKYSFIIKLLLKYFISLERSLKEASGYWKKHFTEGELGHELHEEEKYVLIRLKYKSTHPLLCIFYAGYFLRIAQYVIKSEKITIKELKCMFKSAPYHEYLIAWE